MIQGGVDQSGIPYVVLTLSEREWTASIDTGFNGDLELPIALADAVNPRFFGPGLSLLAGNQVIEEDHYLVDFPFDGETVRALATFVPGDGILLGTSMLRAYRLSRRLPQRGIFPGTNRLIGFYWFRGGTRDG